MKDEAKCENTILVAENYDMRVLKTENKPSKFVKYKSEMKVIDFSFFKKFTHKIKCHRVGDSYVPP